MVKACDSGKISHETTIMHIMETSWKKMWENRLASDLLICTFESIFVKEHVKPYLLWSFLSHQCSSSHLWGLASQLLSHALVAIISMQSPTDLHGPVRNVLKTWKGIILVGVAIIDIVIFIHHEWDSTFSAHYSSLARIHHDSSSSSSSSSSYLSKTSIK